MVFGPLAHGNFVLVLFHVKQATRQARSSHALNHLEIRIFLSRARAAQPAATENVCDSETCENGRILIRK
jgi:hypothetical protein